MKNVLLMGSELGKGGAERSVSLLSYYLEQMGYNITLCILSGSDRQKYYKTCNNVVFIDPPTHSGIVGKIKAWRYRYTRVKRLKKTLNIDVSISFLEGPDYINILTRGKEKIALSIRGSKQFDKLITGIMGKIRKKILIPFLYRKADEIICVTKALADELHQYFGISRKNLTTIYNFYEIEEIAKQAVADLTDAENKIYQKPVIITSGRLYVGKEYDKLIKILSLLKKNIDAKLMILGDGELKVPLMQLSIDLGLTPCDWQKEENPDADVLFMGFQSNAFKYYSRSKVFASSSSWEGFPNVIAEALICNLPVVSTDCPTGPREILNIEGLDKDPTTMAIRTDCGVLMPMLDNPDNNRLGLWANELEYWLSKPLPSKSSFEQLTRRFTLDEMLQQWQKVIEE